jgi:hypothetical protein
MDWGTLPQWLTAGVAFAALVVALKSIQAQREIARKRAAIDFFAKTEMDKHTLDQHAGGQQWNRYNVQLDLVSREAALLVPGGSEVLRRGEALRAKVDTLLSTTP